MELLSLKQIEEGMKAKGLAIKEVKNACYDADNKLKEITVLSRYQTLNHEIDIYYDVYGRCFQLKTNKRIDQMDLRIKK